MILTLDQIKQVTRRMAVDPERGPCSSVVFEAVDHESPARSSVTATSTDGHRIHAHELAVRAEPEFRAVVPEWALRAAVLAADVALCEGAVEIVPAEQPEPGWLERGGENSRGATLRVRYGTAVSAEIRAVPQAQPAPFDRVVPADEPAVVASVNVAKALRAIPSKGEAVRLRQGDSVAAAALWLVADEFESQPIGEIVDSAGLDLTVELSREYLRDALRVAKASGDTDVRLELRAPVVSRPRYGDPYETPTPVVLRDHSGNRLRAVVMPRRS